MPSSDNTDNSRIDRDEFFQRFYDRYPRASRLLSSFRHNPLSGNTLRMMVKGEETIRKDERQVKALETPLMWNRNAPIVISQYANYASDSLPQFWNATLPDIKKRYGEITRYEHHDVPTFSQTQTEYKLASLGRAIQHYAGNEAFWVWFDHVMIGGVQSITEAYELAETLDLDADREDLEDAVEYDVYNQVIWNDINSLLGKGPGQSDTEIKTQLENQDPIFVVFVNGVQVEPSYDSIVGAIEEIRAAHIDTDKDENIRDPESPVESSE